MKKFLLIAILIPTLSFSQQEDNYNDNAMNRVGNQRISVNYKAGTVGSPYLYDEWKEGYIIINDTIISSQNKIQFDLENGYLIIASKSDGGIIIEDPNVTGFAINKENNNKHYYSRISSSKFIETTEKIKFYEILSRHGKTDNVIKDVEKYVYDPNKSKGYQTQNSFPMEYKEKTRYYIKNNKGLYVKTKLNKKSILKILSDKQSELKSYISSHKISFNKENDVSKLLDYYHSII